MEDIPEPKQNKYIPKPEKGNLLVHAEYANYAIKNKEEIKKLANYPTKLEQ